MPVNDLIQFRRGTDWSIDPILSGGEPGFDLANNILKIGDGTSRWSELIAINGSGVGSGTSVAVTGSSVFDYINITGAGTTIVSISDNLLIISGVDGFSFRDYEDVTTTKTIFDIGQTYNSGFLDVYYNGLKLLINEDYYANGGTTFQLIENAASGDIVEWVGGYTGSSFFQDIGGSGITNYITKWKDKNTLTTGLLYDDGTKVGIGTDNPTTLLHLVNPGTGLLANDREATILLTTEASGSYAGFLLRDFNNKNAASFQYGNSGALAFTNEFVIASRQSGIPIVFYQGGISDENKRFILDSSGNAILANCNVGIGTSSPSYQLDLVGTGNFETLSINNAFIFPSLDGASGEFLIANGSGLVLWSGLDIIKDTSPQLGGDLDINSNNIVGTGHISISGDITAISGALDVLSFNIDNESILTKGQISWDDTEGTMDIGLTDNTTIHIGEHRYFRIRNETGGVLYKGQVVYATGVHSNGLITPSKYVADGSVREVRFMGAVLEDVNNQNNGYVVDFGHLQDMDLDGSASNYAVGDETWVAGDILYVHPTVAGKLTKVEPKHSISVGIVLDPGNGNGNGRMFVRPTSYGHLDDNHDVNTSGVLNGQMLRYITSDDIWTTGIIYDNGTNVGIGTSSPQAKLDVNGTVQFDNLVRWEYPDKALDANVGTLGYLRTYDESGGYCGLGVSASNFNIGTSGAINMTLVANGIERAKFDTGGNVTINDLGYSVDFRVEGDADQYLLYAKGSAGSDRVGIGSASPAGKLHVYESSTNQSYKYTSYVSANHYTTANATNYTFGNYTDIRKHVSSGITDTGYVMGHDIIAVLSNEGTLAGSYGLRTYAGINNQSSNGNVTAAYGIQSRVLNYSQGTGNINTARGVDVYINGDLGSVGNGGITNAYGVYIQSILNATNKYGIYQAGSSDINYFAGNVGIGATPSAKLQVEGGNVVFNDNGGNYDFRVEGDTDQNLLFTDASTDRVGIGTASPSEKLHIDGGNVLVDGGGLTLYHTEPFIHQKSTDPEEAIQTYHYEGATLMGGLLSYGTSTSAFNNFNTFLGLGAGSLHLFSSYGHLGINTYGVDKDIVFGTDLTERARITSSGNVGIGTDTPNYKLDVHGTFSANSINVNDQFTFPTTDGSANQILKTDGNGNLSWTNQSGVGGSSGLEGTLLSASSSGVIIGSSGWVYQSGQTVLSQGSFGDSIGDAQNSTYLLRTTSADASWHTLLNNGKSGILLASNRTFQFGVNIVARRTDGQDNAAYKLEGLLYNDGYGCSIIGNPIKTVFGETDASWDVRAVIADSGDSNFLFIEGYGAASKIINWVAKVDLLEVGGNID